MTENIPQAANLPTVGDLPCTGQPPKGGELLQACIYLCQIVAPAVVPCGIVGGKALAFDLRVVDGPFRDTMMRGFRIALHSSAEHCQIVLKCLCHAAGVLNLIDEGQLRHRYIDVYADKSNALRRATVSIYGEWLGYPLIEPPTATQLAKRLANLEDRFEVLRHNTNECYDLWKATARKAIASTFVDPSSA